MNKGFMDGWRAAAGASEYIAYGDQHARIVERGPWYILIAADGVAFVQGGGDRGKQVPGYLHSGPYGSHDHACEVASQFNVETENHD